MRAASKFTCDATGHDGSNPSRWWPPVAEYADPQPQPNASAGAADAEAEAVDEAAGAGAALSDDVAAIQLDEAVEVASVGDDDADGAGATVISFGAHKGKTYHEVYTNKKLKKYVEWCRAQPGPSKAMRDFLTWCDSLEKGQNAKRQRVDGGVAAADEAPVSPPPAVSAEEAAAANRWSHYDAMIARVAAVRAQHPAAKAVKVQDELLSQLAKLAAHLEAQHQPPAAAAAAAAEEPEPAKAQPRFEEPSAAELAAIASETSCYVTLSDATEDVLGFGLHLNGGRGAQSCPCEHLSMAAFFETGIRESTYREPIDSFLPLYLTPEHWERVLKSKGFAKAMGKGAAALADSIIKTMNMNVVAVSSGECHASIVQLRGFCYLHRFLLALLEREPDLGVRYAQRIESFIKDPSARTKKHHPNLGETIILKLVCPHIDPDLTSFIKAVRGESQVRNVLWYSRSDPRLGSTWDPEVSGLSARERVDAVFSLTETSRQLVCFQKFFLAEFGSLDRETQAAKYDAWMGRCTPGQEATMQQCWREIKAIDSAAKHDAFLGMPKLNVGMMDRQIRDAVGESERLGYHGGRGGGGRGGRGGRGRGGGGGGGRGGGGGGGHRRRY